MITRRARRWLRWTATITVTLVVFGLAAATWYLSSIIEEDLLSSPQPAGGTETIEVLAVGERSVRIPATAATTRPGRWGLAWPGGYAELGAVITSDAESVTRAAFVVDGVLRPGMSVAWDPYAVQSDPGDAGIDYDDVVFDGPLGRHRAWRTDGDDDTWVVFVHDRGTTRREMLRLLPSVAEGGYPTLTITYRNHEGAPATDAGHFALGDDEWEDLEAAVEYALASGARDVVLVGYGMGGSVVSMFVRESTWERRVAGVVLDSPLLDPGVVVDADAEERGVPGFLTGWAKALATLRFGIDWAGLDHVRHAAELTTPILLIHGAADQIVPVRSSDALAAAMSRRVDYLRVEDAGHTEAWNLDPDAYEAAVGAFLDEVAAGPSPLGEVAEDAFDDDTGFRP